MEKVPEADDYETMIVDEVTFGDGPTEKIKYFSETENGIRSEFDGKTYNVDYDRSGVRDKIKKKKKEWKKDKDKKDKKDDKKEEAGITQHRKSGRAARRSSNVLENITSTEKHNKDGIDFHGGVAKGGVEHFDSKAESTVQVAYLADVETGVEIWKDVYLDDDNGLIKIYGWGDYAGVAASALAGGLIEGGVFFRRHWANMYNEREYEEGLSVDLGLADGWGESSNWEAEFYTDDYETGWWSVGMRLKVNAAAAGPASAVVDVGNYKDYKWDHNGYFSFDYINVIDA